MSARRHASARIMFFLHHALRPDVDCCFLSGREAPRCSWGEIYASGSCKNADSLGNRKSLSVKPHYCHITLGWVAHCLISKCAKNSCGVKVVWGETSGRRTQVSFLNVENLEKNIHVFELYINCILSIKINYICHSFYCCNITVRLVITKALSSSRSQWQANSCHSHDFTNVCLFLITLQSCAAICSHCSTTLQRLD